MIVKRNFKITFLARWEKMQAQEYLRLRADIAFNRAAHALFLNAGDEIGMTLDMAVIQAISRLDLQAQQDPNLLKAKRVLRGIPRLLELNIMENIRKVYVRKFASEIFPLYCLKPFLKNILNENMNLQGEAKTLYALEDSDIKVFHLLGEIEGTLDAVPKYMYQGGK